MKEPLATKIEADIKQGLKTLSTNTKIPQAKLVEEALTDLFNKYKKGVVIDTNGLNIKK